MSLGKRLFAVLGAPVMALVAGLLFSSIALLLIDESPMNAFSAMWQYGVYNGDTGGIQWASIIEILNQAVPLFFAGLAAAIGFRMGLFNIGVEGQYLISALVAVYLGAKFSVWAPIHVLIILVIAMLTGAAWAGIAGLLKVKRNVNEVISTIMLNYIAFNLISWLFFNYWRDERSVGALNIVTTPLPETAWLPSLNPVLEAFGVNPRRAELSSLVILAVIVGFAFWFMLNRTQFGYDLRASGTSAPAAQASGVKAKAMILRAMLISGGLAGLVGMLTILSETHQYATDFPKNYGFDGIAVALIGRNSAGGAALAALLFGFLRRGGQALLSEQIPVEIINIMTGSIILAAVIAFAMVNRWAQNEETKALSAAVEAKELETA
ncbi:MAG: ABC transporter permease [Acidimicrobiia bacterium]|nr:ABC transporter permease [Acidimicrobiia bacterium]